jgi:hypothetical protein
MGRHVKVKNEGNKDITGRYNISHFITSSPGSG